MTKAPFQSELRTCKQCGQVYAARRSDQRYCTAECRNSRSNWGTRAQRVLSASERGYGREHQLERAKWKPIVEIGEANCCICGGPIRPGSRWHLDHTPDRTDYRGVAHATCNLRDGAVRGNKRRVYAKLDKSCVTCGSSFQTIYPKQVYCSTACRPKRASGPVRPLRPRQLNCLDCDRPIERGKRCKGCAAERNRTQARNHYRKRVGIPLEAGVHDRSWRTASTAS